jgi:hypothetical protein
MDIGAVSGSQQRYQAGTAQAGNTGEAGNAQAQQASPDAQADVVFQSQLDEKDRIAADLGRQIETLSAGIKGHADKSNKLQKYMNRTILGAFCPTTMGVIFGPMIAAGLGMPALAPVVQTGMMALFLSEAAVAGVMKYFQHREDKAITPLYNEAQKLVQEKAKVDKEIKSIKDIKDMNKAAVAADSDSTDIVDGDTYLEIDGLKLEKKQFSFFEPRYVLVPKSEK